MNSGRLSVKSDDGGDVGPRSGVDHQCHLGGRIDTSEEEALSLGHLSGKSAADSTLVLPSLGRSLFVIPSGGDGILDGGEGCNQRGGGSYRWWGSDEARWSGEAGGGAREVCYME